MHTEQPSGTPETITEQITLTLKPAHDPVPLPNPATLSGLSGQWAFQFTPDTPTALSVLIEVAAQTPPVALHFTAEMDAEQIRKLIDWLSRVASQMESPS